MDIHAVSRGPARLWQHVEPRFIAMAVWTERIAGKGEDADPLVLFDRTRGTGLIAVFDGVGGAGRTSAGRTVSGVDRSQAWVASRQVRGLVEEWFVTGAAEFSADELSAHIAANLATGARPQSRMRGTIHRSFPTTLAGVGFQVAGREVRWDVMWAGDSRCYVAEPGPGLQQLNRDDTELVDVLAQLVEDPPMTNMISAGRGFEINHWRGSAALPCVLVCATDGFFGYVDTPAQFEHLLWETLLSAQDSRHWAALLAQRVATYTGDDASLAVVALGFDDFASLRASFRHRADQLRAGHAEPMTRAKAGGTAALSVARQQSWQSYRRTYERRLPGIEGESG